MKPKIKIDKEAEISSEVVRSIIKSIISNLGPKYTAEDKKRHAKYLVRIFEKGLDPYEAMELTEEDITHIYLFTYRLFASGKYAEAAEAFKMLITLVPSEAGFATSAGVCYHKLNNFDKAIDFYLLGAFIDRDDPVPLFYCYDCFMNKKDIAGAGVMLSNVLVKCGDDPKYAKLKDRATVLLEAVKQKIAEKKAQSL